MMSEYFQNDLFELDLFHPNSVLICLKVCSEIGRKLSHCVLLSDHSRILNIIIEYCYWNIGTLALIFVANIP